MIEVNEAEKIIRSVNLKLPLIKVPLEKAVGRVLRERILADTDFPPFDRVMMDGIAIRSEDFDNGIRTYNIVGTQAAGAPQMALRSTGCCLEVMTGAVAPDGSDAIIPYEEVAIDAEQQVARVLTDRVKKEGNIHVKGTDKKKGDLLITEGTQIGTPEIAVAASVGFPELVVTKSPSTAIISTGNELVGIHEHPLPHQIRRSNVHSIAADLLQFGIKSDLYHIEDNRNMLTKELERILELHDLIILSGAVSKGKFDFVPEALTNLGVQQLFHRVRQKPGKPFWFGKREDQKVVFAFPGNPVSTFLCFHKYLKPWLKQILGLNQQRPMSAILAVDFTVKTSFTCFLQVRATVDKLGRLMAVPVAGRGSGDHANLLSANAFLELPGNTFEFKKGELFNLVPFRSL